MHEVEIAKRVFEKIEAKDFKSAKSLLGPTFVFSGSVPEPQDAEEWITVQQKLGSAFPDWSFHLEDVHLDGGKVHATVQITGTHAHKLDLSELGLPPIPASGKRVSFPRAPLEVAFEDGRIASIRSSTNPGGGLQELLKQLGVEMPA